METPLVIGFEKEKALALLGDKRKVVIEMTSTPYKDKIEERQHSKPVVVRQRMDGETIRLTLCQFK